MRWFSRLVTVAVIGGLVAGALVLAWMRVGRQRVGQSFVTYGQFRDASRLPVGSRVMIAGVHVGEISDLAVDGRLARVTLRLRDDVELWDDAWAEKKVASAFGDGYVEVHPGGAGPGRRLLQSGEPLAHVFEGASIDRVLRELDQALPRGQGAVRAARERLIEARRVVGGRLAHDLAAMDAALQEGWIADGLHAADDTMGRFEAWTTSGADATSGFAARLDGTLDRVERGTATAAADLHEGQDIVRDAMTNARARIDEVDPYVSRASDVIADLADTELINDPELGNQIADVAEAGRELFRSRTKLRTTIGLRAEMNLLSAQPRFYVTAEITGHNDAFYLIEAQKSPQGDLPEIQLIEQPGGSFLRKAKIVEDIRFTLQWGKRNDWGALRFGLKESTFGVGGDVILPEQRLRLSLDLFGPSFSRVPQLKLAAAFEVFKQFYLLAGVNDALQARGTLPIAPWPADEDVPTQFRELHYGRDVFLGFNLRFNDEDITTLLAIYGAALISSL